jgi:hypothetical protein
MRLVIEDLGKQIVTDTDGREFEAYVSRITCSACGEEVGFCKVDVDLAALAGNAPAFRASEDQAFIRGAELAHRCGQVPS